jgi:hypothetical protein
MAGLPCHFRSPYQFQRARPLAYRIADGLVRDPALLLLRTRLLLQDVVKVYHCRRTTAAEAISIARRWVGQQTRGPHHA